MQLLTNNDVIMYIGVIERGIYHPDPNRELFKVTQQNGDICYVLPAWLNLHEVSDVPSEVECGKWGYSSDRGFWKLKEPPIEPEPVPEPQPPTPEERLATLEHENTLLRAQIQAAADQNDFLEDCIAEMAGVVYG